MWRKLVFDFTILRKNHIIKYDPSNTKTNSKVIFSIYKCVPDS